MCVCIYVCLLFCICGCGGSTLGSHTETACSSNPVVRKCSGLFLSFFLRDIQDIGAKIAKIFQVDCLYAAIFLPNVSPPLLSKTTEER